MWLLCALACPGEPPSAPVPAAGPGPAAEGAAPSAEGPVGVIGGEPILPRPVVVGALTTAQVEAAIGEQSAVFRACYDAARDPKLAGKVLLRFSVAGNGRAFGVTTRSTSLRQPTVETCLHRALDAVAFPAPEAGTVLVMYPFVFP